MNGGGREIKFFSVDWMKSIILHFSSLHSEGPPWKFTSLYDMSYCYKVFF